MNEPNTTPEPAGVEATSPVMDWQEPELPADDPCERADGDCNLVSHAKRELILLRGPNGREVMQDAIERNVLTMVRIFADEGHSGSSAGYTVGLLEKVLRFEPITPLTGADGEWVQVAEGVWQNARCSHVFKRADGDAYDIEGRVFREPSGVCFTRRGSRVPVTFPYRPKREYVDVPASDADGTDA